MGLFSNSFKSGSSKFGYAPRKTHYTSLSEAEIRRIEGTASEDWYMRFDRRSREELRWTFEQYYLSERFSAYKIRQQVSPAFFGEHPACKPVDFLFFRDGVPLLAVNIVPRTGISHPAIRNIQKACQRMNIKYLRFVIGCPNTEHYVMRRTLEELGEYIPLYY